MTRENANGRLDRLDKLEAQLKSNGPSTVKDLAAQNGVSERTITRDLALMRDRGLPIEADRGRGGGIQLDRDWGVGRINLSYAEAIDLLISIAVAEKMRSPLFLANLASVRRQLVASFSSRKRRRIERLKSRILVGETASTFVQTSVSLPNKRVVMALHQAFVDQESLLIHYKREDGELTERLIEPHYLLLKYPVWYVFAFDSLRNEPRTFRCDRILSAGRTGTTFGLLPKDRFRMSLENDDMSFGSAKA